MRGLMLGSKMLEGQVGIVTGAGTGIGRATALMFAREGASVVVAERDPETGARVAAEILRSHGISSVREAEATGEGT